MCYCEFSLIVCYLLWRDDRLTARIQRLLRVWVRCYSDSESGSSTNDTCDAVLCYTLVDTGVLLTNVSHCHQTVYAYNIHIVKSLENWNPLRDNKTKQSILITTGLVDYLPWTKIADELDSGAPLKIHWSTGVGEPSAWQFIVAASPSVMFKSRGEMTMIGGSKQNIINSLSNSSHEWNLASRTRTLTWRISHEQTAQIRYKFQSLTQYRACSYLELQQRWL